MHLYFNAFYNYKKETAEGGFYIYTLPSNVQKARIISNHKILFKNKRFIIAFPDLRIKLRFFTLSFIIQTLCERLTERRVRERTIWHSRSRTQQLCVCYPRKDGATAIFIPSVPSQPSGTCTGAATDQRCDHRAEVQHKAEGVPSSEGQQEQWVWLGFSVPE